MLMTQNVTIWGRHLGHSFLNILHHGLCHLSHHLKILHLLHAHLPGQWLSMGAVPPHCLTIPPPFVRDAARSSFRTTGVDSIRSCTCIWYLPWHTWMIVRCPIQTITIRIFSVHFSTTVTTVLKITCHSLGVWFLCQATWGSPWESAHTAVWAPPSVVPQHALLAPLLAPGCRSWHFLIGCQVVNSHLIAECETIWDNYE